MKSPSENSQSSNAIGIAALAETEPESEDLNTDNVTAVSRHHPALGIKDLLRYVGPGLLVTVGFIDPGNWASNIAAGAEYGYALLWMVTLSTLILIFLQHNAAHLGITTGLCLSESLTKFAPRGLSRFVLVTAMLASIATSLAEILGIAIALGMLFGIPIWLGSTLGTLAAAFLLLTNSYNRLEKIIIGFVSLIGLSFLYELCRVQISWSQAAAGWVTPSFPHGSMPIIMSVLGAVVMPHNLFLHSEVIQSQKIAEAEIEHRLKGEWLDTLLSMGIGWAINSAMILLAAATFFGTGTKVEELEQAQSMLTPLVGPAAAVIFALALLASGLASTITSGVAAGVISAGMVSEPYDIRDSHSRWGVLLSFGVALAIIQFLPSAFDGLVYSQMCLSVQLPVTMIALILLTGSRRVMGLHVNSLRDKIILWTLTTVVVILNLMLISGV